MEENEIIETEVIEEVENENENKVVIARNTTKLDAKAFESLTRGNMPNFYLTSFSMAALTIFAGFLIDGFKFTILSLIIGIIGLLYPLFFYLLLEHSIKRNIASNEKNGVGSALYTFYEDSFELSYSDASQDAKRSLGYSQLFKVIETQEYMFLFLVKNMAFIVSKEGFSEGSFEVIKNNIKPKVLKYVTKKIKVKGKY